MLLLCNKNTPQHKQHGSKSCGVISEEVLVGKGRLSEQYYLTALKLLCPLLLSQTAPLLSSNSGKFNAPFDTP